MTTTTEPRVPTQASSASTTTSQTMIRSSSTGRDCTNALW